MTARVQMARRGVSDSACSMPKCSGASSSLPIAYVTRAPVFMQLSVVPISARKTVKASASMNQRPLPCPSRPSPTMIIMSPIGAADPEALAIEYPELRK